MKVTAVAMPLLLESLPKTLNRVITSIVFVLAVGSIHAIVEHGQPSAIPFSAASVSTQTFPSAR